METDEETSEAMRQRVAAAREIQDARFQGKPIYANAQMPTRSIKKYCAIGDSAKQLLERAVEKFGLSPRAYHRILKVSRTIADLEGREQVEEPHVSEAIQYRVLDKRVMV